jgi:hypothetical protein
MTKKTTSEIEAMLQDSDLVRKAMERGIRRAVWEHKQLGNPVCVMRDGKIIWLQPHEIDVDPPEDMDHEQAKNETR